MNKNHSFFKMLSGIILMGTLVGCSGEPRAVMLPLQYPDGTSVTNLKGEPVMAGYQTYGSSVHANATALYESARSPKCTTCARVGAVVSEPSVLRQATGVLGASTMGAGAVMTGIGVMDYGTAARDGKLGTNISQNSSSDTSVSSEQSVSAQQYAQQNSQQYSQQSVDMDRDRHGFGGHRY